ncbi:hypothetical protein ACLB2K_030992 [Fragaria x ananassa]
MATYRALLSLKSSLDDPDSRLSALSALRLLNLSNNVFNRTFPPELSNLTNLRVLDLYNNNLTGVLPVSVVHVRIWEKKKRKSIGGGHLGALDLFHLMAEGYLPSFSFVVHVGDASDDVVDRPWWLLVMMLVLFCFHGVGYGIGPSLGWA